jgi:hypothetical protein
VSTGSTARTYGFEVATDAAFANKVYTKDGVAEGSGQTSVKIDVLPGPAAKNYFWRARTVAGSQTGPYSNVLDRSDGPGRWPDVGFGTGSLEYTLGMCVNLKSGWNCSATIQFWYGRDLAASGLPSEIGINWWYDQRWGALLGYQPSCGETVGIYVAAGNLRDSGNVIAKERSNIVMMPFCGQYRVGAGVIGFRTAK